MAYARGVITFLYIPKGGSGSSLLVSIKGVICFYKVVCWLLPAPGLAAPSGRNNERSLNSKQMALSYELAS